MFTAPAVASPTGRGRETARGCRELGYRLVVPRVQLPNAGSNRVWQNPEDK